MIFRPSGLCCCCSGDHMVPGIWVGHILGMHPNCSPVFLLGLFVFYYTFLFFFLQLLKLFNLIQMGVSLFLNVYDATETAFSPASSQCNWEFWGTVYLARCEFYHKLLTRSWCGRLLWKTLHWKWVDFFLMRGFVQLCLTFLNVFGFLLHGKIKLWLLDRWINISLFKICKWKFKFIFIKHSKINLVMQMMKQRNNSDGNV